MSADPETTRIVRSWLRTNEHESAGRVLDDVLARLDATPQRRAWWPARRFADMNTFAKLAAAVLLVVAAGFVGYQFLPMSGADVGGPPVSPSAAPSPSASPSGSPGQTGDAAPASGTLEPGTRYTLTRDDITLTFAVPTTGWSSGGLWFNKYSADTSINELPGQAQMAMYAAGDGTPGIFTDPCAHQGLRQFEDSAAGSAAALTALPGVEVVRAPSDTSVGRHFAVSVAISVPADVGCAAYEYWLAYDPACGIKVECTEYPTWFGSVIRYYFVELDQGRGRFVIRIESNDQIDDAAFEQEVWQIIRSIDFG